MNRDTFADGRKQGKVQLLSDKLAGNHFDAAANQRGRFAGEIQEAHGAGLACAVRLPRNCGGRTFD